MIRFVFITDTHVGCNQSGYHIQPRYLGREAALFEGLAKWLNAMGVAFVVHGGDLTDHGSQEELERSLELCSLLQRPVYLCLGNHDLAQPESIERWRICEGTGCSGILRAGCDCFAVDAGSAKVIVVSHHWHPHVDHQWLIGEPQMPRLDRTQEETLRLLLRDTGRPVIAVTHAPLNGILCGEPNAGLFHLPNAAYLATWQRVASDCRNLRLILCGHNHAHSQYDHGLFISSTTAAFNETPAQVRLITVCPHSIEIETFALAQVLGWPIELVPEKAWCVGATSDHILSVSF